MRGTLPAFLLSAIWLYGQTAPASFQTLSQQAQTARDAKELDKALALYQRALKLKPNWDEGLWSLGNIAYDLDRYSECAPAFRRLASLKPESVPAWTMSGLCEYKLRRYDAALESLSHAESLKFDEPAELARAARLHLALTLTKSGSFERAITVLTELTRMHEKSPEIVVAAGIAGLRQAWLPFEVPETSRELAFKLGDAMAAAMEMDTREALRKFEAAAEQFPQDSNVHFRFGAFLNVQDSDRAVKEIKKAVELAPDHVPALVGLTVIYLKREEIDSALEYGERAIKASPEDFSTHIALGRALLAKENPARAAVELELAVKLAPASPDARLSLASAYSRLGRKEDSARELAEFKRLQHLGN
ncbi:MAG: tetratricopeptide repeat protein [Candidatus Solibacter sp.]|nr:tetratricopeptide repeat protein [Candidatus Solibacter sp.]